MNQKKMYALISHYDTYFKQDDCRLLHSVVMEPHIDALLYAPNEAYPFWKLVNAGASDYKMSAPRGALGKRNEYMMFIDASEDMDDQETAVCLQVVLLNRAETDMLRSTPSSSATSYTPMTETAILSARERDAISSNIIPMILKIVREIHGRFLTI